MTLKKKTQINWVSEIGLSFYHIPWKLIHGPKDTNYQCTWFKTVDHEFPKNTAQKYDMLHKM